MARRMVFGNLGCVLFDTDIQHISIDESQDEDAVILSFDSEDGYIDMSLSYEDAERIAKGFVGLLAKRNVG